MKDPTEHGPAHLPDRDLYPERWNFYDVNLNTIKEDLARDVKIAGNLS